MERSVLVRRTAPVAVFAAVLGGFLALAAGKDGGGAGSGEPRPLPLSMGFRAEGGAGAPRDAASSDSTRAAYFGEIVIPDDLLAGVPTEGPVRTVTKGDTSTERIAALAKALGVPGEVQTDSEGWFAGTGDKVLRVMRHAGSPWYLGADKVAMGRDGGVSTGTGVVSSDVAVAAPATSEPKPEPAASNAPGEPLTDDSPDCKPTPDGTDICVVDPVPADCPPPPDGAEPACEVPAPRPVPEPSPPPQPSDAEARAVAQHVFDAVGVTGPVTFHDGWLGKEVVVAPVVAGLPTLGFETRVTVDVEGAILYAAGFLGGTEDGATYPLLAPRAAVERGGSYGGVRPMIDIACPEEEPCPTPEPRVATGLRLGLMLNGSYDGTETFLAPAWLLTYESSDWPEPVLALPDRFLEQPPAVDQPLVTDPGGEVPPDGGAGSTGSTGAPE